MKRLAALFLIVAASLAAGQNRLLVVSIDGLDHRWLRDADELGLKIPALRGLLRRGARADGVTGIVPTVTWPSHTTLISGVPAPEHGILSNDRGGRGVRWWYARYLTATTLWEAARRKGLSTGAVWWPVTVGAAIDFVLPEYWDDPSLGYYSLEAVLKHSTPGLAERIAAKYPSFRRRALTDRGRVLAARFILDEERPALMLLHLGELDSDQHSTGAFSPHARATLEYQDRLLGSLFEAADGMFICLLADHGFETEEQLYRPEAALAEAGIKAHAEVSQGLIGVRSEQAAAYFRSIASQPASPLAREVDMDEVRRFDPSLGKWKAAFETGFGIFARPGRDGPVLAPGSGHGHHGMWPTRAGFRASFLLAGPGVKQKVIPEISMLDIAPTLAEILGVELPAAKRESLLPRLQ